MKEYLFYGRFGQYVGGVNATSLKQACIMFRHIHLGFFIVKYDGKTTGMII